MPSAALPAPEQERAWISALADGQSDAVAPGCALWRDEPQAREAWHVYHLIGDVLRSEDLASAPARDEAFLAGLRERLAKEPVPLAPPPVAEALHRRLGWRAPAAAAAGFAVVAAAVVLLRPTAPLAPGERTAAASAPLLAGARPGYRIVDNPLAPAAGSSTTSEDRVIRDARLDEYIRAHLAARGNAAAATPGGALRSVEMLLPPQPAGSGAVPAAR